MGLGRLLSFLRTTRNDAKVSDATLDPGGGHNITVEHFADPGDDSHPLPGDYVATTGIPRSGGEVAAGYADIVNDPKATAGESRKYGRDPATGLYVNEVWLKSNGDIVASNAGGDITLKPDGTLVANANTSMTFTAPLFNFVGNVIITGALTISGIFSAVTGAIAATGGFIVTGGDITADGKSLKVHTHAQGNDSGSDTQVETNPPT